MTYTATYNGWQAASSIEVDFPVYHSFQGLQALVMLNSFSNVSYCSINGFYENYSTTNSLIFIISSPSYQSITDDNNYVALVATSMVNNAIRSNEFDTNSHLLENTGANFTNNHQQHTFYLSSIQPHQTNMSIFEFDMNVTLSNKKLCVLDVVSKSASCFVPYNLHIIPQVSNQLSIYAISPFPDFFGTYQPYSQMVFSSFGLSDEVISLTGKITYLHIFLKQLTKMKFSEEANLLRFVQIQNKIFNTQHRFSLENNTANFIFTQRP